MPSPPEKRTPWAFKAPWRCASVGVGRFQHRLCWKEWPSYPKHNLFGARKREALIFWESQELDPTLMLMIARDSWDQKGDLDGCGDYIILEGSFGLCMFADLSLVKRSHDICAPRWQPCHHSAICPSLRRCTGSRCSNEGSAQAGL